ncbi:aldehyde dehydrogenase family protein [Francisella sp. 19X1-34]|uniref:aldehyde dehydrogenase family protein n=1 Tax=Francisella sp. 19X1-34 TaxID=3087177 RepID=UPI002E36AE89|nr:aldehyde dehydrogenase family protein [Francisella sp. 19X1-34]MED7789468.1 aldehyde dehydrogenase family protein [Francisella sp. 19X1-34]
MNNHIEDWISNTFKTNSTFDVINPYSQEVISSLPEMGRVETLDALDILEKGYQDWDNQNISYRAELLCKWADLLEENIQELSSLLTKEQGKPIGAATGELLWAISSIRENANTAKNTHGYTPIQSDPSLQTIVTKQSLGIIAVITPWNFPLFISLSTISGAIAVGNVALCKTSEETPLAVAAAISLAYKAGIPKDVIQYLTAKSPQEIGDTICQDHRVRMLGFTGSTLTGKKLYEKSSSNVKKLLLELGGNSPFVVYDDCDIEKAVNDAASIKFSNCGQICVNANRFLVHEKVYDQFIEKFTNLARQQIVGDGLNSKTTMGPMNNLKVLEKVNRLIEDAVSNGAKLLYGGKLIKEGSLLFSPTVLTNATKDMDIFKTEIFGPVAVFYKFSDNDDVLEIANDTEYGLAAYCYTKDLSKAINFGKKVQAGKVGINTTASSGGPFGGFKESGIGRSSGHVNPLDIYCETKSIDINIS